MPTVPTVQNRSQYAKGVGSAGLDLGTLHEDDPGYVVRQRRSGR